MRTYQSTEESVRTDSKEEIISDEMETGNESVRLICDVTGLTRGSYATVELYALRDGRVIQSVKSQVSSLGQSSVGLSVKPDSKMQFRSAVDIVGRMTLSTRIVGFDRLEDVPEIITR